jgi:two-component system, chemotaxis family, protein-glutamate methylesterase/glutaminase
MSAVPYSGSGGAAVRVMLVDDSAVVRRFLADALRQRGIEVIAAVQDPMFALQALQRERPDVIVLDVEMPRMDGLTFLRQLMATNPVPVVMCSTLTEKGGAVTMDALAAGAVECITKPTLGLKEFLQSDENGLVQAIRRAARSNMGTARTLANQAPVVNPLARGRAAGPVGGALTSAAATSSAQRPSTVQMTPQGAINFGATHKMVAIGLSTGGVQAIERVLPRLGADAPGIVIVQHMPEKFTASLAQRLDGLCAMRVAEARQGDRVLPGTAFIAPGGRHTRVVRSGAQYTLEVFDGPVVNHHRPSVDVLFRSVAQAAGRNAVGVIMTGMGDDGARGLRDMQAAGARTLAQDEASCVVFGMPKEAIKLGAVDEVVPLEQLADRLMQAVGTLR